MQEKPMHVCASAANPTVTLCMSNVQGHPLLSKLWGVVGQQLAQESGSAFHQAEDLTADGVTDPLCSPSAAQAFLEPLVNAEGVAACIMQTRDVVAAQAAAINWDNDSLLKVSRVVCCLLTSCSLGKAEWRGVRCRKWADSSCDCPCQAVCTSSQSSACTCASVPFRMPLITPAKTSVALLPSLLLASQVDARRQSFQRPDILTFSDSDSDDDADDGGRLRRRSSSHARLSRASGGSLPAGGISLLLGSMDDSDDDLDLDFGPDIGKLVADLVSSHLTCRCQQCQDSPAADTAFRSILRWSTLQLR